MNICFPQSVIHSRITLASVPVQDGSALSQHTPLHLWDPFLEVPLAECHLDPRGMFSTCATSQALITCCLLAKPTHLILLISLVSNSVLSPENTGFRGA